MNGISHRSLAHRTLGMRLRGAMQSMFGIDPRSLATFRIGVAGILLLDLWYRNREIGPFFTDAGVLPRSVLIAYNELGSRFGFDFVWSLHMASGQYWAQLLLILVAAWFALWLLCGYRTRLAAAVSWVLLLSLDSRNPDILNSGDVLLRCLLLWSLFLPLGGVWSLDRLVHRPADRLPRRVLSGASAALLLQLAIMYFYSAIAKMDPVWHTEFSGVYYALNCDAFVAPLGLWLREFPTLMMVLTAGTFWLELVGPLVLFLPFWTARIRLAMIGAFWLLHMGLGATLTIGLFPIICIVGWTLFLPAEFWDWLTPRIRRCSRLRLVRRLQLAALSGRQAARDGRSMWLARAETVRWRNRGLRAWLVNGLVLGLLAYVVLWNVRERDVAYWEQRILPLSANGVARVLGLDQNWGMFSPIPRTEDGWLIMQGTLRDGTVVNLWQPDAPLPWDKPRLVSDTYVSQRWRKYLDNLTTDAYALRRLNFCEWLGRRWNAEQAGGDETREVVLIELIHRIEATPPPGKPIPPLEDRALYTYQPLYYD